MKTETPEQKLQRLEGRVLRNIRSKWGGRRDLIDDFLQIGRHQLYLVIVEFPGDPDNTLIAKSTARSYGDIKNFLQSKQQRESDVIHRIARRSAVDPAFDAEKASREMRTLLSRPGRKPAPKSDNLSVRVRQEVKDKFVLAAKRKGLSPSGYLRRMITQELENIN